RSGRSTQCKKCADALLNKKLRKPLPTLTCFGCGKQFKAEPRSASQTRSNGGYKYKKYCSTKCTKIEIPLICINCGKRFGKRLLEKQSQQRNTLRLPKYCSKE